MTTILFLLFLVHQNVTTLLEIESKIISLGVHKKSERKKATFRLKNVGKYNLVVSSMETDCQCAVASLSAKIVKPGSFLMVEAGYDNNSLGYYSKNIYIKGNLPNTVVLTFRGKVY